MPVPIPNNQILIQGHKGLLRQSTIPFLEKADPSSAFMAQDVCFDLQNNLYVASGFLPFGTASMVSAANVSWMGYSYTLDAIVTLEGTTLNVINPTTGAITFGHAASGFTSGATLSKVEWPQTNAVYLSDGSKFQKLTAGGATLTDLTGASPLGAGQIIYGFQDRLWSASPTGNICMIFPSNADTPETFASVNGLRATEDGPDWTALSSGDNVLYAHKSDSIFVISGTDPTTFTLRNLRTGRGAVSKTALYSFERVDYFIGKDGLYRFNGDFPDALHKSITQILAPFFDKRDNTFATGTNILSSSFNYVVPLIPIWGPDYGRRYILFALQFGPTVRPMVLRFDVDTSDWVQLLTSIGFNQIRALAHAEFRIKTYVVTDLNTTQIERFCAATRYDTQQITGVYATQQIDCGTRAREKRYKTFTPYPIGNDTSYFLDLNGAGTYNLNITPGADADNHEFNVPLTTNAYVVSVKMASVGGMTPVSSGFALEIDPEISERTNMGFRQSAAASAGNVNLPQLDLLKTSVAGITNPPTGGGVAPYGYLATGTAP